MIQLLTDADKEKKQEWHSSHFPTIPSSGNIQPTTSEMVQRVRKALFDIIMKEDCVCSTEHAEEERPTFLAQPMGLTLFAQVAF